MTEIMSDSSKTVQEKMYEKLIRIVPDFPKPGIQFVDWMPVCANHAAFKQMLYDMIDMVKDYHFTKVAGLESRGLMLGIPMSILMGLDFVPVRKIGKLPGKVDTVYYELEYGKEAVQIQEGTISSDDSVLIVDDLLATGGTINASNTLISKFTDKFVDLTLIELVDLKGRERIKADVPVLSMIKKYGIY